MKKIALIFAAFFMFNSGTQVSQAASSQTFSDVPSSSPYYLAVENLKERNVIQGYKDGTFRPEQTVNRAEALKMILTSAGINVKKGLFATGFSDVPLDIWYAGYVMEGTLRGIIQGNPDGTFAGDRTVNKAEFLKIIVQTFQIDLSKHQNLSENVGADVLSSAWFSPYLSYAKTVGLTYPDLENRLHPEKLLSRGECAQITYKMGLLEFGSETQKLLSMAEAKLIDALVQIYNDNANGALARSNEALDFSTQALQIEPNSTAVQSTHLLSQAFQQLFMGYKAGREESYAQVVIFVSEAKSLANQAVSINSSAQFFANKISQHGDTLLNQLNQLK